MFSLDEFFFVDRSVVVNQQCSLKIFFVVLGSIQAQFFFFRSNAQREDPVDEFEYEVRYGETESNCYQHAFQLCEQETTVAQPEAISTSAIHSLGCKYT